MATGPLHQLQLTISKALLQPSSSAFTGSANKIYVELIVDGKRGRKTVAIPGTLSPVWDEHFDILVRPDTVLIFYAYNHSRWRADVLQGQVIMYLGQILDTHNGKLQNTSITLDLLGAKETTTKIGELFLVLSGMTVNCNTLTWTVGGSTVNSVTSSLTSNSTSSCSQASFTSSCPRPASVVTAAGPTVTSLPSISDSSTATSLPVTSTSVSLQAVRASPLAGLFLSRSGPRAAMTPVVFVSVPPVTVPPVTVPPGTFPPVTVPPPVNFPSVSPGQLHTPQIISTSVGPTSHPVPPSTIHNVEAAVSSQPSTLSSNLMTFDDFVPPLIPPHPPDQSLSPSQSFLIDVPPFTNTTTTNMRDGGPSASVSTLLDFGFDDFRTSSGQTSTDILLLETGNSDLQQTSPINNIQSRSSDRQSELELEPRPESDNIEDIHRISLDHDVPSDESESDHQFSDHPSSRDSSVSPSVEPSDQLSLDTSHQQPTSSSSHRDESNLPPGWERRVDQYRRVYYVDHNTQTTTWIRPNTNLINRVHTFELSRHDRDSQLASIATRFLPSGDGSLGRLPDGWERRLNNHGMPYFYNVNTDTTLLEDPRIHSLLRDDPLPEGWEMRVSDGGVIFFTNHVSKEQTYRDPRGKVPKRVEGPFGVPHNVSFSWKLSQFRELCASISVEGHIKIHISRENIFQDSYQQIMRIPAVELKRRMHIVFRGEDGLDYGGVGREWFLLLSLEILHPMLGLFQYVNDQNCTMQISAASYVDPNHLEYFRFIGRFIALALYHGMFIGSSFCLPFYKKMLNKRLMLKDIETVDIEVYNSLKWIRDTNLNENKMPEMYFATDFEVLGRVEHFELKPGGSNIPLTEENKNEYIILMIDWMFSRGIEKQTQAFLNGFNEVLPLKWLQYFDEMELELMLCGMQDIDVNDWQKNSVYKHYSKSSKQILWFWKFVQELSNEEKMRLLQFVTGTCRLPVGGFSQLMGSNGLQKFCIEKVGKECSLPRSHTCFNRLDLPPYKSYEQLSDKLKFAFRETEGFGIE